MQGIFMKICPICEELIADEVNICKNCGFSFNVTKKVVETPIHKPKEKVRPRNNNRNNRNYKILQLSNVSLDEVNRWIDEHNGKIKIIGFYGSLQYTMLIAAMAKFKYSTLTIKYYPDVEGYEYKIYKSQHVQLFFSDPLKSCLNDLTPIPDDCRMVGRIQKKSMYPGGNGQTLACVIQLLERKI